MSDPTCAITHLLAAFRRALQAMAPIAEDVGLTWRDGEAYDQWEALGENLFDVLVVSAIAGDLEVSRDRHAIGRYGAWPVPRGLEPGSSLEVDMPKGQGAFAFLRFRSADDFGVMDVVAVDDTGRWADEVETLTWTPGLTFWARLRGTGRPDIRVDRVTPTDTGWPIVRQY